MTGQTVPGRRIPGHWPYSLGPGGAGRGRTGVPRTRRTFLSFNYHPASALAA